eukprot:1157849-Pelagomonas_calceolata.AAC.1
MKEAGGLPGKRPHDGTRRHWRDVCGGAAGDARVCCCCCWGKALPGRPANPSCAAHILGGHGYLPLQS